MTAYYQAAYGRGITSYFQDLYEGGLDMTPDDNGRLHGAVLCFYAGENNAFLMNIYNFALYKYV